MIIIIILIIVEVVVAVAIILDTLKVSVSVMMKMYLVMKLLYVAKFDHCTKRTYYFEICNGQTSFRAKDCCEVT